MRKAVATDETINADPMANVTKQIYEIDLSQEDDSGESNKKSTETNTAAPTRKPPSATNKTNAKNIYASKRVPAPSQSSSWSFNKRQRTRSVNIRYKVSEFRTELGHLWPNISIDD